MLEPEIKMIEKYWLWVMNKLSLNNHASSMIEATVLNWFTPTW